VWLAGLDGAALRTAADGLDPGAVGWSVTDVTDGQQVKAAVAAATQRFGRLDVVLSNAGISGVVAPVTEYPEDVFDDVLAVHVRGSFLVCKHAVPVMGPGGSIIITSSVVGLTADPGICAYATAKHALVGLMRVLAKETAPLGIRVNTLHPGPVDNDFQHAIEVAVTGQAQPRAAQEFDAHIPLGRHATPAEVARATLFLASPDSSFVTGATVAVDGGMSI
jgi:NAD(P)-dependent dehydrogenase (short-subunit alcohol dehydrogenase family)